MNPASSSVFMINQKLLPFKFEIYKSKNYLETCEAIKDMTVRGAGAIGSAAGFAMAQAFMQNSDIEKAKKDIENTRPTAQNLFYATDRVYNKAISSNNPQNTAYEEAQKIADEDIASCKRIGEYGFEIINSINKPVVNILTHCNAGWLAFTDYGTALSPIYTARDKEKNVFVYVSEARPRNQGSKLTAWELDNENIAHEIIVDSSAASFMSQEKVDLIFVGADRIARNRDTANKIGTLDKAVLAKEFNIPFYVLAPASTFDLKCKSGKNIPIEYRSEDEVLYQTGPAIEEGNLETILTGNLNSSAVNPAFDVTPAKYIAGIITENGIIKKQNPYKYRKLNGMIRLNQKRR